MPHRTHPCSCHPGGEGGRKQDVTFRIPVMENLPRGPEVTSDAGTADVRPAPPRLGLFYQMCNDTPRAAGPTLGHLLEP